MLAGSITVVGNYDAGFRRKPEWRLYGHRNDENVRRTVVNHNMTTRPSPAIRANPPAFPAHCRPATAPAESPPARPQEIWGPAGGPLSIIPNRRRPQAPPPPRQRFQSGGLNFPPSFQFSRHSNFPPSFQFSPVIPAKAGIYAPRWTPAKAGATDPHLNHPKGNTATPRARSESARRFQQ